MEFKTEFESSLHEIERNIQNNTSTRDEILNSIEDLQRTVKSRLSSLTTFDQEKYDAELQKTREQVWKQSKPRRFKFKSNPSDSQKPRSRPVGPGGLHTPKQEETESTPPKSSISLIHESRQANLNLSDLKDSVVIAPVVSSSLYMARCSTTKVFVSCQQCRIHNCENISVYLENCRNPVVEACNNIKFYIPADLNVEVSDFSWMNLSLPSPHYSVTKVELESWKPISSYTKEDLHMQQGENSNDKK